MGFNGHTFNRAPINQGVSNPAAAAVDVAVSATVAATEKHVLRASVSATPETSASVRAPTVAGASVAASVEADVSASAVATLPAAISVAGQTDVDVSALDEHSSVSVAVEAAASIDAIARHLVSIGAAADGQVSLAETAFLHTAINVSGAAEIIVRLAGRPYPAPPHTRVASVPHDPRYATIRESPRIKVVQ